MYLDYWQLKRKPFENTPDPDFFYFSPEHEEAYIRFKYAILESKGAILLTGDYGCGKTTLVRLLVAELDPEFYQVAIINHPRGEITDLLKSLLVDLEEQPEADSIDLLERQLGEKLLRNFEEDKTTLLIIDEAQLINKDAIFEEIRLLLNFNLNDRFLINLFLIGQPELRDRINNLPQFEQRIFCKFHLRVLNHAETTKYINHRISIAGATHTLFSPEAISLIHKNSFGTPRRINNICDLALLFGSTRNAQIITKEIIQEV
ncbi:MAG: AAA family ATPase [Candidatus Hatepunaea meridiana]|nr:AAA family ATPase [Candidatus Hatepunaea meridiana]